MRTLQTELVSKGLSDACIGEVNQTSSSSTRGRSSERLRRWEIEELMGVNRQKYSRGPGGAMRGR